MRIEKITYLKEYKIEVLFSNGEIRIADLEQFVTSAKQKSIHKYSDVAQFKKAKVDCGFLSWNNGEMELSADSIFKDFSIS